MDARTLSPQLPQWLLPWYEQNKRDLPWRQDREPYHIWVSEIMLQQTRVEAVKGYYTRFLAALPDIPALAACGDDALHKLWEGLGYYSRVRNLKKAAQQIVSAYGGVFPRDYGSVRGLPGIGPYTAGAICSIAFDLPTPAVDGNVLRVVSRLWDDGTPIDTPEMKQAVPRPGGAVHPGADGAGGHGLRPQPDAGLPPLPLRGPLPRLCPRHRRRPAREASQAGKAAGGEDGFHSAMRRLLCPAQTATQGPAGGAVGISQCAGDFDAGGGHRAAG